MNKIKITNVNTEDFEGFRFIGLTYECDGYGFGTINIDNCGESGKLEINECHLDYAGCNKDFKQVCDYITSLIENGEIA